MEETATRRKLDGGHGRGPFAASFGVRIMKCLFIASRSVWKLLTAGHQRLSNQGS